MKLSPKSNRLCKKLKESDCNYRLNKVQDILDMDISDLDNRIQLRLAFMVRDMLD